MRVAVHATPKSGRNEVCGWRGSELDVRVTAPPEAGKANGAVCEVIAAALGVPKRSVRVVRGDTARHKQVEIDNVSETEFRAVFGEPQPDLFS